MELQQLLDPKFDASTLEWDTLVSTVATCVESREFYQKILGKVASSVGSKYGEKRIFQLSSSIEEMTGRKISPDTLRNYRWVWEKVGHLSIPDDVPYTAYKTLASTDHPEEWLQKMLDNGWSAAQLLREIKIAKGESPKKPHVCPNCGFNLDESKKA